MSAKEAQGAVPWLTTLPSGNKATVHFTRTPSATELSQFAQQFAFFASVFREAEEDATVGKGTA